MNFPTYESIGVRPLINCKGTYTIISGSLMLPEARAAMAEASKHYVDLDELMEAVGRRIAEVMQCEWGLITNGCAAALCAVTAGILTGGDREKIRQLPDTTGMKNEVLVQPSHRFVYDHAVRMTGVKMIEVETLAELEAAVNEKTAMMLIFGDTAEDRGTISVPDMVKVAKKHKIPTFADAAAERPDVPNWYLNEGVDVVAYSGGKCLRGPQSSGLVLGNKQILQAAFANHAPHHSIGRPMKAGKEEIMAQLAAVEMWVKRDHEAEWKEWERRLKTIEDAVTGTPSLTTWIQEPGRSNVAPILRIDWDAETVGLTPEDVRRQPSDGEPRIEMFKEEKGVSVMPYMMEPGDDAVVADRLKQIFGGRFLMNLVEQGIEPFVHGAVDVSMEDGGARLSRMSPYRMAYFGRSENYAIRARCNSGIMIGFTTNSPTVDVGLTLLGGPRRYYGLDTIVNGAQSFGMRLEEPDQTLSARVADGGDGDARRVEILLGNCQEVRVDSVEVADDSTAEPLHRAPFRLLAMGDSITQGMDARSPSSTYPTQVAHLIEAELHNQGVGGHVFDPEAVDPESFLDPGLVTVAYGTNDWNGGAGSAIGDTVRAYLEALRASLPVPPIVVISPIWCSAATEKRGGLTLWQFSEHILNAAGDVEGVIPMDGSGLVPHQDYYFQDGLHPNDEGFHHYAKNLYKALRDSGTLAGAH